MNRPSIFYTRKYNKGDAYLTSISFLCSFPENMLHNNLRTFPGGQH